MVLSCQGLKLLLQILIRTYLFLSIAQVDDVWNALVFRMELDSSTKYSMNTGVQTMYVSDRQMAWMWYS